MSINISRNNKLGFEKEEEKEKKKYLSIDYFVNSVFSIFDIGVKIC